MVNVFPFLSNGIYVIAWLTPKDVWSKFVGTVSGAANELLQEALEGVASILTIVVSTIFTWTQDIIDLTLVAVEDVLTVTPKEWSEPVFTGIQNISEVVINPIAIVMITFVMCYEIYNMVVKENSMAQDGLEVSSLFRLLIKMSIAVFLLGHNFEITTAFFDLGKYVVEQSIGQLQMTKNLPDLTTLLESALTDMTAEATVYARIGYLAIMVVISAFTLIVSIAMGLIAYFAIGERFIEIFIYLVMSPLAFATLGNQETSQLGKNYIKNIIALAFQGFFIVVIYAIYLFLLQSVLTPIKANMDGYLSLLGAVFKILAASFTMGTMMYKSRSISKSIFNAH